MKILKLGMLVKDKTTGLKGMITIFSLDIDSNKHYLFQPAGLNPKTKEPLDTFWITSPEIIGGTEIDIELPINILNSQVEDKATKFSGTATQLFYYLNGCIHFSVKPKGVIKETGECIKSREFDLRRLQGKEIKQLTELELEKSKKTNPSPEIRPALVIQRK